MSAITRAAVVTAITEVVIKHILLSKRVESEQEMKDREHEAFENHERSIKEEIQ